MRVLSTVLALAVSLVMAGNLAAGEKKAVREARLSGGAALGQFDEMVKGLNLTDDQKAKLEEIKTEYAPKVKEVGQKAAGILTPEQKTARQEALKAAKAAGKTPKEARKEAQAAVKLTEAQKVKLGEARKAGFALRKEIRGKVLAILTPEQKAQLNSQHKQHRQHSADSQ